MTQVIVLAAGQGTRLRPLTNKLPKTLVELMPNHSLLDEQLAVYKELGLHDVTVIGGYCIDKLKNKHIKLIENQNYATSNMVTSLFCAHALFDGQEDIIVVYGDIVFETEVLEGLLRCSGNVVVTADKSWLSLWQLRMDDPLLDAETFKFKPMTSQITELGKKPKGYSDIDAQYIGLIKFSKNITQKIWKHYQNMAFMLSSDNYKNLYFTDFIQSLIDQNIVNVTAHIIDRGWLETDSIEDLRTYQKLLTELDYKKLGFKPFDSNVRERL